MLSNMVVLKQIKSKLKLPDNICTKTYVFHCVAWGQVDRNDALVTHVIFYENIRMNIANVILIVVILMCLLN
jgi:hypothetical protein